MRKIEKKYLAIIYIILSAFFFALMNLFVSLSGDLPVMQKVFFRNLIATGYATVMLLRTKGAVRTGKGHVMDLLIRAVSGTVGIFCNFYAISYLDLADASILNKLSPFFAIIFSIFVVKEKPKKTEWFAVILAFVGALFVVKPSFSAEVVPALVGVLGGLGAGLAYTYVRKMGKAGVNGNLIIFCFSAFSCLASLPSLIFNYSPMTWLQLTYLLLAGVAATGGQVFITKAYSNAPAKEISVYDYSIVIFSAILGFIFLSEIPDWMSFIGYFIIIFAAGFNWYHSTRDGKKKAPAPDGEGEMPAPDAPAELPEENAGAPPQEAAAPEDTERPDTVSENDGETENGEESTE